MRVKRGTTKNRRHKKVLELAKGYRMTYHRLYKRAKEAVAHAGQYNYAHRKHRRGEFRSSWIKIIAAGLANSGTGLSYNAFQSKLNKSGITLDRKVLSNLATTMPSHFNSLVNQINK